MQSLIGFQLFDTQNFRVVREENYEASIPRETIYYSIASAFGNMVFQTARLILESKAIEERVDEYALKCIMARIGWIPFKHKLDLQANRRNIRKNNRRGNKFSKPKEDFVVLDYNIKYNIPLCTKFVDIRGTLDFDFSDVTIGQLTSAISLLG